MLQPASLSARARLNTRFPLQPLPARRVSAAESINHRQDVTNGYRIVLKRYDRLVSEPAANRFIDDCCSDIDRDLFAHGPFAGTARKLEPKLRLIFFTGNRRQVLGLFQRLGLDVYGALSLAVAAPSAPGGFPITITLRPSTEVVDLPSLRNGTSAA